MSLGPKLKTLISTTSSNPAHHIPQTFHTFQTNPIDSRRTPGPNKSPQESQRFKIYSKDSLDSWSLIWVSSGVGPFVELLSELKMKTDILKNIYIEVKLWTPQLKCSMRIFGGWIESFLFLFILYFFFIWWLESFFIVTSCSFSQNRWSSSGLLSVCYGWPKQI